MTSKARAVVYIVFRLLCGRPACSSARPFFLSPHARAPRSSSRFGQHPLGSSLAWPVVFLRDILALGALHPNMSDDFWSDMSDDYWSNMSDGYWRSMSDDYWSDDFWLVSTFLSRPPPPLPRPVAGSSCTCAFDTWVRWREDGWGRAGRVLGGAWWGLSAR